MSSNKNCIVCGVTLTTTSRRRSHILTKSSYFSKQISKPGEHLMGIKDGAVITDDMGHFAWEYLLCDKCELKVGKWEQERERLFSSNIRSHNNQKAEPYIEVTGYNQKYIKLACLADLFRCSEAVGCPYEGIDLGPIHTSIIREILKNENCNDPNIYPVIIARFNDDYTIIDGASNAPLKERGPDGIRLYETLVPGGWIWIIKVDKRDCPILEKASLGAHKNLLVMNYGNARKSKELLSIYKSVRGA